MSELKNIEQKAEALAQKLGVDIETVGKKVEAELHALLDKLLVRADTDAETVKTEVTAAAATAETDVKADAKNAGL